ncbi:MAG: sensor histidine kinase [Anaerolineae bacterium]
MGARAKVLLVDDERAITANLEPFLERAGFNVHVAADGEEGLHQAGALKFSRPGDTVEVRAFEDGASVNIEVADTGPGICEEELAHVWEELYRGQAARGTPGSGLGLALTRAIIERHSGQVALRSRVGQGTVVTLRLPVAPHSGAGASLRSP